VVHHLSFFFLFFFCLFHPSACFVIFSRPITLTGPYFPKDRSSPIIHCLMPCRHPAWQHVTQERNPLVCLDCRSAHRLLLHSAASTGS
jgi:ABC-type transport system involved in multi-copper enzyme maturation permease subunit